MGEFGSPGLDLHINHQVPVILYVVVTVEVLVLFYGRGGQGRKINRTTKYQFLSARWPRAPICDYQYAAPSPNCLQSAT